jgi:hypothetical protein
MAKVVMNGHRLVWKTSKGRPLVGLSYEIPFVATRMPCVERRTMGHGPWFNGPEVMALKKWVFSDFWIMAAGTSPNLLPNRACLHSEFAASMLATYGSIVQKFWRHASVPDPDRPNTRFSREHPGPRTMGAGRARHRPAPMVQWSMANGF